jgi:pilus assembly protein CpaC
VKISTKKFVSIAVIAAFWPAAGFAEGAPSLTAKTNEVSASTALEIEVPAGKSKFLELPGTYTDVMIADPKIADVVPLNPHAINIIGKSMGTTALTVYGAGKRVIYSSDVMVTSDTDGFKGRLHDILPNETGISASTANQSLLLSGTVSSPAALQQVLALAETYDPGKVVNMLAVQGAQQVMLSVRFVEMERTAAKNLRLNSELTPTSGSPSVSFVTGDTLLSSAQTALGSIGNFGLSWAVGGGNLDLLFDALETKGLVKTLAEPTLTAMSGDTANFLAGGEFPIPVNQSSAGLGTLPTITVEYKQFGISLAFTPTVLQDGLVNMVVNPEVSSIDPTTSVSLGSISVPGIKIRRTHTTVELRDGESFTIAGLMADNYQNSVRQYPFLGDIPVLGTLFRSTGFQRDQTELVIIVTPHLVTPHKGSIATPADHFVPPSDFELFLFGTQRGKAENLAPEDRVLMSVDPTKGGVDGQYGHVLY